MAWHVYKNNNAMEVHDQQDLLNQTLSQCVPGDIVVVKKVDYIERETTVYGNISGGNPFPPAPTLPIQANIQAVNHVSKK